MPTATIRLLLRSNTVAGIRYWAEWLEMVFVAALVQYVVYRSDLLLYIAQCDLQKVA